MRTEYTLRSIPIGAAFWTTTILMFPIEFLREASEVARSSHEGMTRYDMIGTYAMGFVKAPLIAVATGLAIALTCLLYNLVAKRFGGYTAVVDVKSSS